MLKEPKTIGIYIWEKNLDGKPQATTLKCFCDKECPLLKRNECLCHTLFGSCPYGSKSIEVGPTSKAKSHYEWMNKQKELRKDKLNPNSSYCKIYVEIGDYVYLPYAHMTMCETVPFLAHSVFMISGIPFIKSPDFRIDNIVKLIRFRPFSLFGGEITDYQNKSVKCFLFHLKYKNPELFNEICKIEPTAEAKTHFAFKLPILVNLEYVPADGQYSDMKLDKDWDVQWWNGTTLKVTNKEMPLLFFHGKNSVLQYEPDPKHTKLIVSTEEDVLRIAELHPEIIEPDFIR
jgi:hypothetical protein